MMNNPVISVVVPVYNVEKYLDKCIESILNQTYKNLEIILVDDGSPDNCPKMCDEWAKKDKRIKVVHKENGGTGSARNAGINAASGEYIGFVDSDDFIKEDMYEVLFNLIVENNAQIAKIAHIEIRLGDETPEVDNSDSSIIVSDKEEMLMRYMEEGHWDKLYKKDLFTGLPETPDLHYREDNLLNFFLYRNAEKMVESTKKEYFFVRHFDSITSGCINYYLIDDSLKYYKFIEKYIGKDSNLYNKYIYNRVMGDFFSLNSIIRNNKCRDRYNTVRSDILKYKKFILKKEGLFEFRHKQGVMLLLICPKIYDLTILVRRKIRGY